MKWLFVLPLLVILSFSLTFPEPVAATEAYYIEEGVTPQEEDSDTYWFRSTWNKAHVKWWLPYWFVNNHHPQVAFHFVEVPSPDPDKELVAIKVEMTEYLTYYLGVLNIGDVPVTVSTDRTTEWLTFNIIMFSYCVNILYLILV